MSVLSEPDAAWLAGVIDSEGTVSLVSGAHGNPCMRIQIYNSSDSILDKAATALHDAGVAWSEGKDERAERTGYILRLGTAACLSLYEPVRPHMVRHASRYDASFWFFKTRTGRIGSRIRWSDQDKQTWANLRKVFNAK